MVFFSYPPYGQSRLTILKSTIYKIHFFSLNLTKITDLRMEKTNKRDYKELSQQAIDLIAEEGISLSKACERLNINRRFFFEQIKLHTELSNNYARACEIRCDMIAEEIITLSDSELTTTESKSGVDAIRGSWNEQLTKDNVNRTKLQIDARKWLLAKMMPKKYGNEKEDQQISVNIQPVLSNNPLADD